MILKTLSAIACVICLLGLPAETRSQAHQISAK